MGVFKIMGLGFINNPCPLIQGKRMFLSNPKNAQFDAETKAEKLIIDKVGPVEKRR